MTTPRTAADLLDDLQAHAGVIADGQCFDRLVRWITSRRAEAETAEPAPLDALDIRALNYALPDGISYLATQSVQRTRKGMVNWIADRYVAETARLAAGNKGGDPQDAIAEDVLADVPPLRKGSDR